MAEAIYTATKGKSGSALGEALKRSVRVLQDKRMLGRSEDVLGALQDVVDRDTGVVRMKVTTAKSMGDGDRIKLENEIKEKYKAKSVVSEFFEKPELLGGMRIEIRDEVTDTTYKNKLRQLEKFLIK